MHLKYKLQSEPKDTFFHGNKGTLPLMDKSTPCCLWFTLHVCARENKHSALHFKHLFPSLL